MRRTAVVTAFAALAAAVSLAESFLPLQLVGNNVWGGVIPTVYVPDTGALEIKGRAWDPQNEVLYTNHWYAVNQSGKITPTLANASVSLEANDDRQAVPAGRDHLKVDVDGYDGLVLVMLDELTGAGSVRRLGWTDIGLWSSPHVLGSAYDNTRVPSPVPLATLQYLKFVTNAVPSSSEAAAIVSTEMRHYDMSAVDMLLGLTNSMPAFESAKRYVDVLCLPQSGIVNVDETDQDGYVSKSVGDALDIHLLTSDFVSPVAWRYRHGNTRTVPVDLEHASETNANYTLYGRVAGMWYDAGGEYTNSYRRVSSDGSTNEVVRVGRSDPGVYARIELNAAGVALLASGSYSVSPAYKALYGSTSAGDRVSIPWQIVSLSFVRKSKYPTSLAGNGDVVPFSGAIPGVPRGD